MKLTISHTFLSSHSLHARQCCLGDRWWQESIGLIRYRSLPMLLCCTMQLLIKADVTPDDSICLAECACDRINPMHHTITLSHSSPFSSIQAHRVHLIAEGNRAILFTDIEKLCQG